jgi:hypothetical protein
MQSSSGLVLHMYGFAVTALKKTSAVVCYLRSQNESDRCDCKSDWDRAVVIRSAAGAVGDVVGAASEAGQEAGLRRAQIPPASQDFLGP